jgi:hypothetical protein
MSSTDAKKPARNDYHHNTPLPSRNPCSNYTEGQTSTAEKGEELGYGCDGIAEAGCVPPSIPQTVENPRLQPHGPFSCRVNAHLVALLSRR